MYKFLFDWSSISSNEKLVLKKSFVRVFIETNLTADNPKNVSVNVSASVQLIEQEELDEDMLQTVAWGPVAVIEVGHDAVQFLEVEIKQQLATVWNSRESDSLIQIQLKFKVDCKDSQDGEAPFQLSKPVAGLNVTDIDAMLLDETLSTQPFLVIFADDPYVRKQIVKMELLRLRSLNMDDMAQEEKVKRQLPSPCSRENFTADFSELGFFNIINPQTLDVGQCVGDCDFITALTNDELFNYHAAIMTVVVLNYLQGTAPYYPCCIPTRYGFQYLLVITPDLTFAMEMEPIVAEECGCR